MGEDGEFLLINSQTGKGRQGGLPSKAKFRGGGQPWKKLRKTWNLKVTSNSLGCPSWTNRYHRRSTKQLFQTVNWINSWRKMLSSTFFKWQIMKRNNTSQACSSQKTMTWTVQDGLKLSRSSILLEYHGSQISSAMKHLGITKGKDKMLWKLVWISIRNYWWCRFRTTNLEELWKIC